MKSIVKRTLTLALALLMLVSVLAACGGSGDGNQPGTTTPGTDVAVEDLTFPLAEKAEISGLTSFPVG
ncbi:MAG: ABC transporter substrate-binding protein, partial [bacterium]